MPPSRALADFRGDALYVDAMILVAFIDQLSAWHDEVRRLFAHAVEPGRALRLVTSVLTIDEVAFVLLQELVAQPPYSVTRSRSQYLANRQDVVRRLARAIEAPIEGLVGLLELEPVVPEDLRAMQREMVATGLLPRDAIHVAVMRRLGLTDLASDDRAFDRCPDLVRFAP